MPCGENIVSDGDFDPAQHPTEEDYRAAIARTEQQMRAAGLGPAVDEMESIRASFERGGVVDASVYRQAEAEKAIRLLLRALGGRDDDHTTNTPARAARMWAEMLGGYNEDPRVHLRATFSAPTDAGLVIQSGIEMTSVCAHHMLPFTGRATIAYRPSPGQNVVGLSKLTRVLQGYARRLQIQEAIGIEVVQAIREVLMPAGVMCLITASHGCMRLRGVRDGGSETTTVAQLGLLLPDEVALIRADHLRNLAPR